MNVGSCFSGIGLLDYGLHLAGLDHAWLCEADPWRRELLAKRFPGTTVFDDIRAVGDSAPRVDLLAGGFPCRGASTAGDRAGMGNPETALWREMARVIRELRPRLVLLENVANLLAIQRGAAWGEVLGDLASLGYVCSWDCLPAAAFGAPHLRDRVFCIAAHADGEGEGRDGGIGQEQGGRPDAAGGTSADASTSGRREGERDIRRRQPDPSGITASDPDCHALRQQPEPERGGSGAAEPGIAPCGCRWDYIDADGFCACCHAHLDDPRGLYAEQGDGTHHFAECLAAADLHRGELPAGRNGSGEHRLQEDSGRAPVDWGGYSGAIERWEEVAGPAPEPLLRGVDARGTRKVVRSRLSGLGDGVQVRAGLFLGQRILNYEEGSLT